MTMRARLGCPGWLLTAVVAVGLGSGMARAQPDPAPVQAGSVFLNHPTVVDTAHLKTPEATVTLFGVKGQGGAAAQGLQAFITANGDRVTCHPHDGGGAVCVMPTGLDVAATALANGAAETVASASADYREQEAGAQAAHLGIWAALPPAPVLVQHPVVQTTAEIVGDGQVFLLAGLVGFPAQYYTMQLQSYIAAHGDLLSCQAQPGGAVCVLPDGTDIATVALLNGLARVGPDASPAYQADQAKAEAARSGFWFNPPQQVLAALPSQPVQPCCVLDPNDTLDALNYDNGVPTAVIDGEPAFFLYGGLLGWGFYDLHHRWHAAPEAVRAHLDQFHPGGRGLRVPASAGVPGAAAAFRAPGAYGAGNFRGPFVAGGAPLAATGVRQAAPAFTPGTVGIRGAGLAGVAPAQGMRPVGIVPGIGFTAMRPGFAPVPFHRPAYAPSPIGVARLGGFNPRIAAPVPHIMAPPPVFLGRR